MDVKKKANIKYTADDWKVDVIFNDCRLTLYMADKDLVMEDWNIDILMTKLNVYVVNESVVMENSAMKGTHTWS